LLLKPAPPKKNHLSHKGFHYLLLALVVLLVFQLSSCALIGYGVGAIADSSAKKRDVISIDTSLPLLKPGTNLTLYLKSGRYEKGKCIGLLHAPRKGYAEIYAEVRDRIKDDMVLPALGERITVVKVRWASGKPETSRTEEVEFLGFDYGGISVWEAGRPQPTLMPLASLQSLSDQRGNILNMDFMERLMSEQKVPFLSSAIILLKTEAREVRIDFADVYMIEVTSRRNRAGFFFAGLSIDVFVLLVLPFSSPYLWILWGSPDF
jgi:hypothetical protein